MASFYRKDGVWIADVYKRGRIRLGRNKANAWTVYRFIERIEQASKLGVAFDVETRAWIEGAGPKIRNRLRRLGLVDTAASATIGDLVEAFKRTRSVKPSTRIHHDQIAGNLFDFFGESTAVSEVSKLQAKEYRVWLSETAGLASATAARRFTGARSIFALAVESGWLAKNPFAGVKAGRQTNGSRSYFVTPSLAAEVLAELDGETRLAFALARWGGLRIPSEAVGLRWVDIDFERRAMKVFSPKTEAHEGKGSRIVPIFPELRPILEAAREAASADAEFLFPELRETATPGQSLRSRILKVMKRIDVDAWPKLFVNLRASRATEIDDRFGAKAESEWIGHGADIAMRHYLIVRDETFAAAAGF